MNDISVISFIADEMLTSPHINAQMVINAAKLAEEDPQMFKLMKMWMYFPDNNDEGQMEVEKSIEDYLRKKSLWSKK